ncbi:23171_t:CDS:2, partial [Racocetra persica]
MFSFIKFSVNSQSFFLVKSSSLAYEDRSLSLPNASSSGEIEPETEVPDK